MSSLLRIFVPSDKIVDNIATVTGSDYFHIVRVMRLGVGDSILVCDMKRRCCNGRIVSVESDYLTVLLSDLATTDTEPKFELNVFQALAKGDKLDTVVQKSTELGATSITPVLSERCVVRPDKKGFQAKRTRLERIASSAASQCGRLAIPSVEQLLSYEQALDSMKKSDLCFVCYEGEHTIPLKKILTESSDYKSISFLIGPEGGLSIGETEYATEKGIPLVGLGNRILRTETAALFVLSAISVICED